ncbi:MAG: nucleotide pyrophosphohydrolase [Candidatus Pacebacteria bacterium]|nr:nucleotide pyrophosphohydrolase [Candidatus Paceibacterota bacterium]
MLNDKNTNIQTLKDLLIDFRNKRDWKQFHDPKNLAEAISIEAGELQELFLWKDKKDISKEIKNSSKFKEKVGEELADIIIFCLNFANSTDLDVSAIIEDKIKKAEKKYSVEKAKGNAKKYTELEKI